MSTRTRSAIALLAATASVAVPARHAEATIVEFRYEGSITSIDGEYTGEFFDLAIGGDFAYSYVIDLDTPDLIPDPTAGRYEFLSASVEVGGQSSAAADPRFIRVDILDAVDEISAQSTGFFGSESGNVVLTMRGAFAIESDAIPVGFDLSDFPSRTMGFGLDAGDDGVFVVQSTIDAYTMTVIPGPGAAIATVASTFLLSGGRRRRSVRPCIGRRRGTS